ncbi:MAG: hypothetical protein ACAI44_03585 [Candidatus Sericytochromatia bacterium]
MNICKISLLSLLFLAGCDFKGSITQPGSQPSPGASASNNAAVPSAKPTPADDDAPQIQSANANPRVIGSAQDVMTFTINAFSPVNSTLEFTWTATKGFMSATKGESVQWYPVGSDGKAQPGPAVITCIITDTKNHQKKIDFNILILPSGGAEMTKQTES